MRSDDYLSLRTTLVLARSDIDGLLTQAEVIAAVETAHADLSTGIAVQPPAIAMSLPTGSAAFLAMPALANRQGLAAVKLLADIPENAARQLPMQRSVTLLVSLTTGAPIAIFHGQIPTRIRTASASAVATKHLSRPDSRVLGLIGAGDLAVEHVRAIREVRPIERVVAWSRTGATLARFFERVRRDHPDIEFGAADSPADVFSLSDVICTLTPSREPYIAGAWFRPGQHINAVGAPPRPDHREIDSAGMARASLFFDSIAIAIHDSGDLLLAIADGAITKEHASTEIGDVITGAARGRTSADEITLFNSVGLAIQDLAIGNLLVAKAREKGIGREFDLAG